jgi:hypothetical protein
LKTTFLKRSEQIGVNTFFQLTVFVQDSDRVPVRKSANYGSTIIDRGNFLLASLWLGQEMFQRFILIRAIVNVPTFYPRCPNPCNYNLSDFTWFFSAGPVDSIREIRFKHVFILGLHLGLQLGLQLGFAGFAACSTRHRQVN